MVFQMLANRPGISSVEGSRTCVGIQPYLMITSGIVGVFEFPPPEAWRIWGMGMNYRIHILAAAYRLPGAFLVRKTGAFFPEMTYAVQIHLDQHVRGS